MFFQPAPEPSEAELKAAAIERDFQKMELEANLLSEEGTVIFSDNRLGEWRTAISAEVSWSIFPRVVSYATRTFVKTDYESGV